MFMTAEPGPVRGFPPRPPLNNLNMSLENEQFKPEELGSFEVTEENKTVRNPNVSAGKYVENEVEFINNPARQEATQDLVESWEQDLRFDDVVEDNEAGLIAYSPDNYIAGLINMEQRAVEAESLDNFVDDLDEAILKAQDVKSKLEKKQEILAERRMDFEELKDVLMKKEIKERLELIQNLAADYLANAQKVLDYAQGRRSQIII